MKTHAINRKPRLFTFNYSVEQMIVFMITMIVGCSAYIHMPIMKITFLEAWYVEALLKFANGVWAVALSFATGAAGWAGVNWYKKKGQHFKIVKYFTRKKKINGKNNNKP